MFRNLFILSSLCLLVLSCSGIEDYNSDIDDLTPGARYLLVRGATVDSQTATPINGMQVVLLSYPGDADINTSLPLASDTTYTASNGRFEIKASHFSVEYSFRLLAKDVDGPNNGGRYQEAYIDINLPSDNLGYFASSGTFLLDGNILYMEK